MLTSSKGGFPYHHDKDRRKLSLSGVEKEQAEEDVEAQQPPIRNSLGIKSLDLRRLPVNALLMDDEDAYDGHSTSSHTDNSSSQGRHFHSTISSRTTATTTSCLRSTCLNPNLKLRTQLMLAFGTVNAVAIAFVVVLCIIVTVFTGNNIQRINEEEFTRLANRFEGTTARYLADNLEKKFMPLDLVRVLNDATQDRFDDTSGIHRDVYTRKDIYPILGPFIPMEWDKAASADFLVNENNYQEHLQGRWDTKFYRNLNWVSTASAGFFLRGSCDTRETNTSAAAYWPNCTDANNDFKRGGIVSPTDDFFDLYSKASDLVPLLKALFELNENIRDLGLYFANDGGGATVNFPHFPSSGSYTSIGCEWMSAPNPYDPSKPIGTRAQIQKCAPNGQQVNNRVYNPMERGWCRDQALTPEEIIIDVYEDAWNPGVWLMSLGKAIYDRVDHTFVACSYIGITLDALQREMSELRFSPNSEVSIINYDSIGTVVASSMVKTLVPPESDSTTTVATTIQDLDVGVRQQDYDELFTLVDYSQKWDPAEVRRNYEKFEPPSERFFVSCYPIPPIPSTYTPNYRPHLFVIRSTSKVDLFAVSEEIGDVLTQSVNDMITFSLIVGAIGLACATFLVIVVANTLTSPLKYMSQAMDSMMDNFGKTQVDKNIQDSKNTNAIVIPNNIKGDDSLTIKKVEESLVIPLKGIVKKTTIGECFKTEINFVVQEFDKMVEHFSGSLSARSERMKIKEGRNKFSAKKEFRELYNSRNADDFLFRMETTTANNPFATNTSSNRAHSTTDSSVSDSKRKEFVKIANATNTTTGEHSMNQRSTWKSPLFLLIAIFIVTPLFLTTASITYVVMSSVSKQFQSSIKKAEDAFLDFGLESIRVQVKLRADNVRGLTEKAVQDLHILTRYGSWVLFDGLRRANSYSVMTSGIENCKVYDDYAAECPYYKKRNVCDCEWDENSPKVCQNYTENTRKYQIPFYTVPSHDADPVTGNVTTTHFPKISYSSETTGWQENQMDVPGAWKGPTAAGYETTYDRMRVISSVPIMQVLYHYGDHDRTGSGIFYAFEADGSMIGYLGCRNALHVEFSRWSSSEASAELRPEICPVGKYGFDARCRAWYDTGRKNAIQTGASLLVTAPYLYATTEMVYGQSATAPLIDPRTGEYVGQVLVDFLASSIFQALESKNTPLPNTGFPILLSVHDSLGNDAVIGPEFKFGSESRSMAEVVLPNDYNCYSTTCRKHISEFNQIISYMKQGDASNISFYRTADNGAIEKIYMAYSPVQLKNYAAVNSSDFARGVEASEYHLYSLGLAVSEDGLLESFQDSAQTTQRIIKTAVAILACVILLSVILVVKISFRVAVSITAPMLYLLDLIRAINELDTKDYTPAFKRQSSGSEEIIKLSETMETLYKVVQSANDSFYTGQLEVAYVVLMDSLRLFRSLDNHKAIGVACNNLGNTLLGMYRLMKDLEIETMCGLSKKDIIARGTKYFYLAITMGEKLYDNFYNSEGWTPRCLDFMQHLSNRYFNRGIFLLTIKDDHKHPDELLQLGMRDLQIARDMDDEVISYGEEIGWERSGHVASVYSVAIARVKGYNLLLSMGLSKEEWGLETLLEDLFNTVKKEMSKDHSDLFEFMAPHRCIQEVETQLIQYYMTLGDLTTAAKIAVRLLFEDGHALLEAQVKACTALLLYVDASDNMNGAEKARLTELLNRSLHMLHLEIVEANKRDRAKSDSGHHSAFQKSCAKISVQTFDENNRRSIHWSTKEKSGSYLTMEAF